MPNIQKKKTKEKKKEKAKKKKERKKERKKAVWILLTVCSCHGRYAFQSESTLYICLNVKELLPRSRCEIWSFIDCHWTRSQNDLVRKWTLNHLAKLACSTPFAVWVRVQLQSLKLWILLFSFSWFTKQHDTQNLFVYVECSSVKYGASLFFVRKNFERKEKKEWNTKKKSDTWMGWYVRSRSCQLFYSGVPCTTLCWLYITL